MKKRIVALILSVTFILSLAGCSSKKSEPTTPTASQADTVENDAPTTPISVDTPSTEDAGDDAGVDTPVETQEPEKKPVSKYDTSIYVTIPERKSDISGTLEEKYNEHFVNHVGSYDNVDFLNTNLLSEECIFCRVFELFQQNNILLGYDANTTVKPYFDGTLTIVDNTLVYEQSFFENGESFLSIYEGGDANPFWLYFFDNNDNFEASKETFALSLIYLSAQTNIIPDNYTILLRVHPTDAPSMIFSTDKSITENYKEYTNAAIDFCTWWENNRDGHINVTATIEAGDNLYEYYSALNNN